MRSIIAILALSSLVGCTDEVDISGLYQTSYHTRNDTACDTEGPAVTDDPPYFLIEAGELFGQEYYSYSECSSADEADCSGFGLFGLAFTEPTDGGWRGESSLSVYSGDICTLTFASGQAILADDGALEIEWRTYSGEVALGEDACLDADAADRRDELACAGFDVIVGQPVASP